MRWEEVCPDLEYKLKCRGLPDKLIQKILPCCNNKDFTPQREVLFDRRNKKLYYFKVYNSLGTIRDVSDNISFLNEDEREYLYRELYPIFSQIEKLQAKKAADLREIEYQKALDKKSKYDKSKRQELKNIYCKRTNTQ